MMYTSDIDPNIIDGKSGRGFGKGKGGKGGNPYGVPYGVPEVYMQQPQYYPTGVKGGAVGLAPVPAVGNAAIPKAKKKTNKKN